MSWTHAEAIELCRQIETICPDHGCHVGLTGGLLYKTGERKDLDLVFYRIRQVVEIDWENLSYGLAKIGFEFEPKYKFVTKAKYNNKPVDILWPEAPVGAYDL